MEVSVTEQLAALAHPRRLDVFRLLMRRYPDAVPAGEIATALPMVEDGSVAPPEGPGLGLSLKPELFTREDATVLRSG